MVHQTHHLQWHSVRLHGDCHCHLHRKNHAWKINNSLHFLSIREVCFTFWAKFYFHVCSFLISECAISVLLYAANCVVFTLCITYCIYSAASTCNVCTQKWWNSDIHVRYARPHARWLMTWAQLLSVYVITIRYVAKPPYFYNWLTHIPFLCLRKS